jgi:tripeptidyl-peptidase-1
VGPSTLFTTYNIPSQAVANAGATSGLFEAGQYFVPLDIQEFQANFSIIANPVANVVGNNDPTQCSNINNCAEAELDIQYLLAMAQSSQLTFWSINPQSQTPFLDWIMMVSAMSSPPSVHSISYGEVESQGDAGVMKRFNAEVMKLGAQGVSVMVASGDDGVANFPARTDPTQCGFQPSYPANDPYVTSVGATQGPESGSAEIACTSAAGGGITTGGGFAINFAASDWQKSAIQTYLSTAPNVPPQTDFNAAGRGYPDVALLGHAYNIIVGSNMYQVDGTSASSPVFAGIIAQINGARLAAGKKTLGFLNQAIYQLAASTPAAFNDITSGENNCCAGQQGSQTCCPLGFTAAPGWDPLTGWGSINYPAFSAAFIALP